MINCFKNYLQSFSIIFLICFVIEYFLSDFHFMKWTSFRYCFFLSLLIPFVTKYYQINKSFIVLQVKLFILTGVSVPALYKLTKSLKINGSFIWDELATSLSIIFVFLLLRLMLELFSKKYQCLKSIFLTFLELIILLPYLVAISYSFVTGDFIDVNSLIAVYQTNFSETIEFFSSSVNPIHVFLVLIIFLLLTVCLYKLNSFIIIKDNFDAKKLNVASILFLSLLASFFFTKVSYSTYFNRIIAQSQEYVQAINAYNNFRINELGQTKQISATVKNIPEHATFLVIIGESQNKNHMSAYGYERNTTPWAKQMRQNKDFVFFNNAYACHTLTMQALSQALTESSQYNSKKFATSYSLVDIAKAAGFKTYWISNQSKFGSFSTPVSLIAELSDKQIWLNSDDSTGNVFDEEILKHLSTLALDKGKNVVFIHLMGNHWEYKNRYPKAFSKDFAEDSKSIYAKAKNKKKLDEYDSSMFYNDYVVQKIFDFAKTNWNLYNMLYFSDHGEAVLSDRKHIPGLFEIDMAEIPVYLYFSEQYQKDYPQKFIDIKNSKDTYFTNDMIFDAAINIWNIETPFYNSQQDFLSESYSIPKERLSSLESKIKLFQ